MKRNVVVILLYAIIFPKSYILRMIDKHQSKLENAKIAFINKCLMQDEILKEDVAKVEFIIEELVFYQVISSVQMSNFRVVYYSRVMFLLVFIICLLHFL